MTAIYKMLKSTCTPLFYSKFLIFGATILRNCKWNNSPPCNMRYAVFASKRSAVCNRCFRGPTRVLDANGISIASVVFAGLTKWQTDIQTDRPRYSIGNNRRHLRT